jgi:Leucine-rich repeat (LRR) protein
LSLKGFTNLEELDCSGNQLTNLDLRDCPNLIEINVDNNELCDLGLLKTLSNPEKLEKFWVQNNSNLITKNLNSLAPFTNLRILDISGCSKTKGSLKSLEKLTKLR